MIRKRLKMTLAALSLAVLGCAVAAQGLVSSAAALNNLLTTLAGSSQAAARSVVDSTMRSQSPGASPSSAWSMREGQDVSGELGIPGARTVRLIRGETRSQDKPIVITQVPLGRGTTADFELEPFDVFTPNAWLVAMANGVETPLPRPTVRLYKGRSLDGSNGSMFLSINGSRFRAVIEHGGEMTYILPSSGRRDVFHIVIPGGSMPRPPIDNFCGTDLLAENRAVIDRFSEEVDQAFSTLTTTRLEADLMIDVNYSLYASVFNRSTTTATNYAADLIGAVSAIYERDVNVQLRISTLTIWTTQDPFNGTSSSGQLAAYRSYVIANRSGVSRDAAHLLANGNVTNYGGIAYLDVLCNNSYGYGVSNIYGDAIFPAPGYEWDIFVVSHELGHNFGSVHTHCYVPPIDMCYGQEPGCYSGPPIATTGTIMSYCHLTSGGVILVFHQRCIDVIRPNAEAARCLTAVSTSPSITVSVPNGGENWQTGTSQSIQWTSSNVTGNVKIELSRNGATTYETLFPDTPNDGSESWTVAGAVTTQARIKVSSVADPSINDTSNANFTISTPPPPPSITVTSPNGGEWWQTNTTQTITWTSTSISGNVKIRISRNGGSTYKTLFNSVANTGSIQWTVTGSATTQARIQVVSVADSTIRDESDSNFTISDGPPPTPSITVVAPNGGQTWQTGSTQTIQWTSSNISGNVKIELSRSGSGGSFETLFANTANDGSENWTVTGPTSSNCFMKVSSVDTPSVSDLSDAAFTISSSPPPGPSITVLVPNGGESWRINSTQAIQWTSSGISGNVKIRLSRNGGSSYKTLFNNVPNTGSIQWTVSGPASSQCRIQVVSADGSARDSSDGNFSITP
ncbi:MAG: zinc-dependent metalloprotease [Acidobacteria bacterium]|nr:zinc-dependent metalloprotease [Acidobacteriota bacterium]